MEPGPLPPHERTWRHPSELGPTRVDVAADSRVHTSVLVAGALAVVAVATMVVVMTPRPISGPAAISVTTTPIRSSAVVTPPVEAIDAGTVSAIGRSSRASTRPSPAVLLTGFAAYPHAITSAPQPDLDRSQVADATPDDGDVVYVRTEDVTYRLEWGLLELIEVPDGSVVFDETGDIVARVTRGDLVSVVGD